MENAALLHHENNAATGISKAERNLNMNASTLRRTRLSDITNLASDRRSLLRSLADGGGKDNVVAAASATGTKDAYIAQLLKENNALMRALAERNKVIELSNTEIQNLGNAFQKLSHQNQQLAQANSLMLAERNKDKDRLKAFQHEMGCHQTLLKSKNLELEEKKKLIRQLRAMKGSEQCTVDCIVGDAPIHASNKKACNTNRKRTRRTQSLGTAAMNHQVETKEKDESSRKSSRRRSLGLKHDMGESNEDLFEIEDVNFQSLSIARDDPMSEENASRVESSTPVLSAPTYIVKQKVEEQDSIGTPHSQNSGARRSSIGRPTRRAAEKVCSYKEVPLNVKMRRPV